jgi:hypothetical protein
MTNELIRRKFLQAGCGVIAGAGSTALFNSFSAVSAQSSPQVKALGDQQMTVNVTKNADGTITCWGKAKMIIPSGGAVVRQIDIGFFPEFAEEPIVTVSIYTNNDNGGSRPFTVTGIDPATPKFTLFKITATDCQGRSDSLSTWFCNFIVIGKPL